MVMETGKQKVLSNDMATVGEYLHTWKIKFSTTKTMSAVFLFNSKEAKRDLNVNHTNETMPFCSLPKNIGVTLDRTLTYRQHHESLRKVQIMRRTLEAACLLGLGCWSNSALKSHFSPGSFHSRVLPSCLVSQF